MVTSSDEIRRRRGVEGCSDAHCLVYCVTALQYPHVSCLPSQSFPDVNSPPQARFLALPTLFSFYIQLQHAEEVKTGYGRQPNRSN